MSNNYELKEQFKSILGIESKDFCEDEETYFKFFEMGIEYCEHVKYESRLRTDCFVNNRNTKDLILHCIMSLLKIDDEFSAIKLAENAFNLSEHNAESYILDFRRFRGV